MAADSVVYTNAVLLLGGASLAAQLHELSLNYKSEMHDRTTFGDTTRNRRGGLFVADLAGKGFASLGSNLIEDVLFGNVGTTEVATVIFPNGVTEGSQTARAYAMLGATESFKIGGPVGGLLPVEFVVVGAGLG